MTVGIILLIVIVMAAAERFFGRRFLPDGPLYLFGSNSRYPLDWYSLSHVIHGFIFYWIFRDLVWAVAAEAAWEVLENSPWVINRYRETASADYQGDTVLNSVSDVLCVVAGFFIASTLGWAITLGLLVFMELLALWFIRDNLTLNIVMLIYASPAIKRWQQELNVKR